MKKNSTYFSYLMSAKNVLRWKGNRTIGRDSAGISAARSAMIANLLIELEEAKTGPLKQKDLAVAGLVFKGVVAKDRGDMRYSTKNISKMSSLRHEAESILLNKFADGLSNSIKNFILNSIELYDSDTTEGKIMRLAKKFDSFIFANREYTEYNNLQFKVLYENTKCELVKSINEYNLESSKDLFDSILTKDTIYDFIADFYNQDKEYRWDTFERSTEVPEDDDAIHCFRASAIALFFGLLENAKFGKNIDFYNLTLKPLYHDLQEVMVGDIILPIKYATEKMKKTVHNIEDKAAKQMIKNIKQNSIKKSLETNFIGAKDDTFEGELCNLADKLDSLLFANEKANQGSLAFKECFRSTLASMQENYEQESFKFFLAYILYDLIK